MTLSGEYEPSPEQWVRDQVEQYEATGGQEANILRGRPEWPIVVITSRGAKSGKLRKNPVMRVEKDGVYAAVASKGGAPKHPTWYYNFLAHPEVDAPGRARAAHVRRPGRRGRGAGGVVGALRGPVRAVRRVPGEDRPGDPAVPARTRLSRSAQAQALRAMEAASATR